MLATKAICTARRYYFTLISKTIMYRKTRWLITCMLALLYLERVKGFSYDVITYLIFFYLLQLIISYFTPKSLNQEEEPQIFVQQKQEQIHFFNEVYLEEKKPLIRSMGQLEIWERVSFVFFLGLICTCFKAFQIDVFWPVLMLYSGVLFCYTIHKIITKMEKYRYKPEDFYKKSLSF